MQIYTLIIPAGFTSSDVHKTTYITCNVILKNVFITDTLEYIQ